jgi:hypothetical protein
MRDKIADIIHNADEKCRKNSDCQKCEGFLVSRCIDYLVADELIANGVILPPMRLGQICYKPYSWQDEAVECRVSSITQKADGTFKIRLTNLRGKWVFEITAEDIGKTVFLTKEEAEKALKEKENEMQH